MTQTSRLEYVANFDGLRGIAVLIVLIYHGSYGLLPGGFLGVDLFFIMSGYLITAMLWSEYTSTDTISLRNFYARRILRLYPALFFGVVIALLLWRVTASFVKGDPFIAAFSSFFYLANLVDENYLGNMSPFWSLSVEEHFYLIWPTIMLFVIARLSDWQKQLLIISSIIAIAAFRIFAGFHVGEWRYGIFYLDPYGFTICRMDCILIGALMYFSTYRESTPAIAGSKALHRILLILSLFLFTVSIFMFQWSDPLWLRGGFIFTNLVTAIVVMEVLKDSDSSIFHNKAIIWIGQRSYGIYVYHYPIFLALESLRKPHDVVNLLLVTLLRILLSIAIAALSYWIVERPALRYKKRFQMSLAAT